MKFKSFLSEQKSDYLSDEFVDEVIKKCKPALGDIFPSENFLYRLVKIHNSVNLFSRKPRLDRTPSDTPHEIHTVIDDWFYQKFGYKYRSQSLFVTNDYDVAEAFANDISRPREDIFYIIPSGNFKICYSKDLKNRDLFYDWINNYSRWIDRLLEKKSVEDYLSLVIDQDSLDKEIEETKNKDKLDEMLSIFRRLMRMIYVGNYPTEINNYKIEKSKSNLLFKTVIVDLLESLNYVETNSIPDNVKTELMLQCSEYFAARQVGNDVMYKIEQKNKT